MNDVIPFLGALTASLLLETGARRASATRPEGRGIVLHLLAMSVTFGVFLAASGNVRVAAVLTPALTALFTLASSAKKRMLGEPLVFSDLALIGSIFRHPRFYFTALPARQRRALGIGAAVALVVLVALFSTRPQPHLAGGGLLLSAGIVVSLLLRSRWFAPVARTPDLERDIARYGLTATLLLYWWRWRAEGDPPPCPPLAPLPSDRPEIVVIVQCESFADPVELTGDARRALPGLAAARAAAWQAGRLEVSGFGAYTMRTEYGVLFGRGADALGFRRYDPFLTAGGETSYALSARLRGAGYRCAFVHPHDLRFYGRDRLMPAIGFESVVGRDGFAAVLPGGARYVDDRTLGETLIRHVDAAVEPTLLYAVTMENHGPWDGDEAGRLDAYLRHVENSDAMLRDLVAALSSRGRPALLVFFGDHRPSIPGVTAPDGPRDTPYVMLRFDAGRASVTGSGEDVDLTPAGLHHAILRCIGERA